MGTTKGADSAWVVRAARDRRVLYIRIHPKFSPARLINSRHWRNDARGDLHTHGACHVMWKWRPRGGYGEFRRQRRHIPRGRGRTENAENRRRQLFGCLFSRERLSWLPSGRVPSSCSRLARIVTEVRALWCGAVGTGVWRVGSGRSIG